jgi:uncharacterized protein
MRMEQTIATQKTRLPLVGEAQAIRIGTDEQAANVASEPGGSAWALFITRHGVAERIILFGSHARGDANRWSDIDLLVVFDEPVDKRETAVKIQRVLRGFLVAKDVIVTDTDEVSRIGHLVGTVLRPALREGELIYERE